MIKLVSKLSFSPQMEGEPERRSGAYTEVREHPSNGSGVDSWCERAESEVQTLRDERGPRSGNLHRAVGEKKQFGDKFIIGIPREITKGENRVAATPDIVKKYLALGFDVQIEKDAGTNAGFADKEYNAKIVPNAYKNADIILKIWEPTPEEEKHITNSTSVIANFPNTHKRKYNAYALNLMPRISRAQSMDILSSQSNLAGYKAVIEAASKLDKAIPLMMTSAGTIPPVRFFIIGIGVAGLQAIATAKRLGGQVYATDIRPETKEQVESLGGKFTDNIPDQLTKTDVLITTALTQGKPSPILVTKKMIKTMPKGAIIVDIGGNVEGAENSSNIASSIAHSASTLYAKNLYNFIELLQTTPEDEIIQGVKI